MVGRWEGTGKLLDKEREKGLSACSTQPTRPDRGWFVAPFGKNPWWVYPARILRALLVTFLILMDLLITAVFVTRKDNKVRVRLSLEQSWRVGGRVKEECSSVHSQRSPRLVPLGEGDVFLNKS